MRRSPACRRSTSRSRWPGQSGIAPCLASSETIPDDRPLPAAGPPDRPGRARGRRWARSRCPPGATGAGARPSSSMLEASGLAGRGGAGFPAAIKLAVAHAAGRGGTIVVNGMEGEPASDKDKLLLHAVAAPRARRRPAAGRRQRGARSVDGVRARGPRPRRRGRVAAMAERTGGGLRAGARGPGAAARPLRRRRGVGAGALGRFGRVAAVVPARQGHRPAHRPPRRAGAQRRDAGPRRHDRPDRARTRSGPTGWSRIPVPRSSRSRARWSTPAWSRSTGAPR